MAFTLRRFADTFGVVLASSALVEWTWIHGAVRSVRGGVVNAFPLNGLLMLELALLLGSMVRLGLEPALFLLLASLFSWLLFSARFRNLVLRSGKQFSLRFLLSVTLVCCIVAAAIRYDDWEAEGLLLLMFIFLNVFAVYKTATQTN